MKRLLMGLAWLVGGFCLGLLLRHAFDTSIANLWR